MLKRTQDRKTANLATKNGKQSKIANAFSLPAGREFSCPGATDFCESICYAGKLEKIYAGFRGVVLHNWGMLKDATIDAMYHELLAMIDAFKAECEKHDADKLFRIHADGDFFSATYAHAWRMVIEANPGVHFWAYTRVTDAVAILSGIENLDLYFSADPNNAHLIPEIKEYGVKIATVAKTFEDAQSINKGTRCPDQTGAIPLISEKGGACITCGLCVNGRKDVVFSASKK